MTRPPLLLALEDPACTPEEAALWVASDAYPELDHQAVLRELDALAEPLSRRLARVRTPLQAVGTLGTYVFDELAFRGNEADYYDPRNSYLQEVLARRLGIPITLAVVLLALSRRAGLALQGVPFPGHFLLRTSDGGEPLFLDPFFRARIVRQEGLKHMLKRALGPNAQLSPEHLEPATTQAIAIRLLTNLKAIYASRKEHARALVVCDRLVDLTGAIEHRRDRGALALALGALHAAQEDLRAYLAERPDAPDLPQVSRLLDEATQRHLVRPAS